MTSWCPPGRRLVILADLTLAGRARLNAARLNRSGQPAVKVVDDYPPAGRIQPAPVYRPHWRGQRRLSAVRKTMAVMVAAGSLLLGIAAASPALAKTATPTQLCSPTTNGGPVINRGGVLPGATVRLPYEPFI